MSLPPIPIASGVGDETEEFARFNLIGRSPSFTLALARLRKIAACDATTLIEGETGTGKELAARAIHYLGARASFPFLPVNCGAIPDNLIENELFGHAKGAYTDARAGYGGLISDARGGTLLLDEVEALSPRAQVALLRFLHDGVYRPLGTGAAVRADVRIVAASNANLHELAQRGEFRHDLMYRLNVMILRMPPLRDRGDDIVLLVDHFLRRFSAQYWGPLRVLAPACIPALLQYRWPGNVRELENLVHREFLMADAPIVRLDPADAQSGAAAPSRADALAAFASLELGQGLARAKAAMIVAFERTFILRAITETNGNVSAAARRCGKERRSFGRLLKKHGIDKSLGALAEPTRRYSG